MIELLAYITSGADVSYTEKLYIDRASLAEYRRLEEKINNELDVLVIAELESQKHELAQKIDDECIKVNMHLPSPEARTGILAILDSEQEWDYNSPEYNMEATLRLITEAIQSIEHNGTEEVSPTVEDVRAFRDALKAVPANWRKLVDRFDKMIAEETLTDSEMTSPDFS